MKKLIFTVMLFFTIVVSSACADAQLQYTLSDDHVTTVRYALAFEQTDQDVAPYLNEIGSYWAKQDMSIYVDKDEKTVTGEKTVKSNSAKEAAAAFSSVFTSEGSLFSNVSFAYTPSLAADDYSLTAEIDLNDVIRQQEAQGIPADQVLKIEDEANNGDYKISVSLPGDVVDTNADARDGNVCTWALKFGELNKLSIHTQKQNTEAVQNYNKLNSIISNNTMLLIIVTSAAGFCVLMIVLSFIIRKAKQKRASEIRVKHFR